MRALIVIAAVADLALGALLVAVSGFVLQGVNDTGPMMPEAIFYVLMILWCLAAPVVAWLARDGYSAQTRLGIVVSPLAMAAALLLVSPG